jgi:hypothetical protein
VKQTTTSCDTSYYMLRANSDGFECDYCDVLEDHNSGSNIAHMRGQKVTEPQDKGDVLRT